MGQPKKIQKSHCVTARCCIDTKVHVDPLLSSHCVTAQGCIDTKVLMWIHSA